MAKHPKNMGEILTTPLPQHMSLTFGKLFKELCKIGGWTYEQVAEKLHVSPDAVKRWVSQGSKPKYKNFNLLMELIYDCTKDEKTENSWIQALTQSWMREKIDNLPIEKLICQYALTDPQLTRLPSLFETEHSLPLATAYVELRLTSSFPTATNPRLLETNLSLKQRLIRKHDARYAIKRNPKDLIDENPLQGTLILGEPGAGKSSLLRRVALDIAEGKWNLFKIPLFVEARTYWMARKSGKSIDLLTFAVSNMLPPGQNIEEALMLLVKQQKVKPFILLVDGLDEIASDSTAVDIVYTELKQLRRSVPWVVTARPSGLMASLGRPQRCEVVGLDDDAIEILIDNWCVSIENEFVKIDGIQLKTEIFGSPSMQEMACNPFLLTALCFLKSIEPEGSLPISRIGVYEALLRQIRLQAQRRHQNRNILAPNVLSGLQEFAYSLYNQPDGATQIFGKEQWREFSQTHTNTGISADDFDLNILPSRLLSSWGGIDTEFDLLQEETTDIQFHFLHLSLQEHLIARAMLNHSLEEALERRFKPSWRAVFRFYGALLLQQGQKDKFRHLTSTLYREKDINKLSLLTLANIFADVGINDTKDWIGDDLREELYNGAICGFEIGPEAMIDALATLDPKWLEDAVCKELDEMLLKFEQHSDSDKNEYDGRQFIILGRGLDSPYEKLARSRTVSAKRILSDTFWGNNQNQALMAAYAYATVATPSERQVILDKTKSISMSDCMAIRIFAFSLALYRPEFVPFLGNLLNHYSEKADGPFTEALNLVADIGGKQAVHVLEALALQEADRLSDEFNAFEVLLNAIVRMGGHEATKILNNLEKLPQIDSWKDDIRMLHFEADPSNEKIIFEALADSNLRDSAISALSGAANYDRMPSKKIIQAIKSYINTEDTIDVMDLAFLESARLDKGKSPILCDTLLDIANQLYIQIHDGNDVNDIDYLKTQLSLIFDTLSRAEWKPSSSLINTILSEKQSNKDLLESAIVLAGYVYAGTSNLPILIHLREILFQDDGIHAHVAAVAIGRIDLEDLFRLQSAEMATYAMEEIAAESDILIFDEFWVDRSGNMTKWQRPPKKILYVYDDNDPEIPQLFAHELSQYGFCFEDDNPETCVAYLVFSPTEEYAKDLAEQAKRINHCAGSDNPLIDIPKDITEDKARTLAKEIGIQFLSRYEQMKPLSLQIHY